MVKPYLILISGKRYSGKDTFASYLVAACQQAGQSTTTISTALPLKQTFCHQYGLDLDRYLADREYKEDYRQQFSQFVLTQDQHANYLVIAGQVESSLKAGNITIIPDLRSSFDLHNLRQSYHPSLTILMTSAESSRRQRGFRPSHYDRSHFETELDTYQFDVVINNNGTLVELQRQAHMILTKLT